MIERVLCACGRVRVALPGRLCSDCAIREHRRLSAGCLAMSRFLVWVWCEAMARWESPHPSPPSSGERMAAFIWVIEDGRLRLDWSRP